MARDTYLQSTVEDYLSQADMILVSVPADDRSDYSDTRLFTILQKFSDKPQVFLDWNYQNSNCDSDDLSDFISERIDKQIAEGKKRIIQVAQLSTAHIASIKQANTDRFDFNEANKQTVFLVSLLYWTLCCLVTIVGVRELVYLYDVSVSCD
jgi:GTPase Era involved in 16S rRNA processing